MIHLTFSGFYAGQPFCKINRESVINEDDTFMHYSTLYNVTNDQILNDNRICADCKKVLNDSLKEEK